MPGFRLSARYVFLTYPQADLEFDSLYDYLLQLDKVQSVYACQENHQDGNLHYHAIVQFTEKRNIRDERYFDFGGKHPNIEAVRNLKASNEYIGKDGIVRGNPIVNDRSGRAGAYARALQESRDSSSFMGAIEAADPIGYVNNYERIARFATIRYAVPEEWQPRYPRSSFRVPSALDDWVNTQLFNGPERPKTLVIVGEPNSGKTAWAMSLAPHNYWCKWLTGKRNANARYAIFDDFDEYRGNELKGFWGAQPIVGVKVSNGVSGHKQWKWGLASIFLYNSMPEFLTRNSYESKVSIVVNIGSNKLF